MFLLHCKTRKLQCSFLLAIPRLEFFVYFADGVDDLPLALTFCEYIYLVGSVREEVKFNMNLEESAACDLQIFSS